MTWKDLEAVYNHLKSMGECHTQKEFADIIGQSPENVSKKLGTLNPVMPLQPTCLTTRSAWIV